MFNNTYMFRKMFYNTGIMPGIIKWIVLFICTKGYSADTDAGEQSCPTRMRSCDISAPNSTCIWDIQTCDGEVDCHNNNEERNCQRFEMLTGETYPSYATRIIPFFQAYRIPCNTVYGKEGFLCDNGECTLKYWFCDGTEDCSDGSDEALCNSTIWEQGVSDVVSKQLLAATCNHWVYYQCGFKYPTDFLQWKTWDEIKGYVWTKQDFDSICSDIAATIQCVKQHVPQCFGFEEGLVFYDHVYNILCQPPNITFAKALLPCFNDASTQIALRYYSTLTQKWNFYGPGSKEKTKMDVKYSLCLHNFFTFENVILGIIDQNCQKIWTNLIVKGLAYRIKEPVIRKYGNFEKDLCNARIFREDKWDEYINPVLKFDDWQLRKLQSGQLP